MSVTFLSSKRSITWRLKTYLCDWLSSSNSKDEIEGCGHGHGTRESANVAANSIKSLSKYGSCSSNVGNIWTSIPSTKIFDAEKLRCSMVLLYILRNPLNDSHTWWIEKRLTTPLPLRRKVSRWKRASYLCLLHASSNIFRQLPMLTIRFEKLDASKHRIFVSKSW